MLVAPLSHVPIKGSWFLKGQFILESDILFFNHPVQPADVSKLSCAHQCRRTRIDYGPTQTDLLEVYVYAFHRNYLQSA